MGCAWSSTKSHNHEPSGTALKKEPGAVHPRPQLEDKAPVAETTTAGNSVGNGAPIKSEDLCAVVEENAQSSEPTTPHATIHHASSCQDDNLGPDCEQLVPVKAADILAPPVVDCQPSGSQVLENEKDELAENSQSLTEVLQELSHDTRRPLKRDDSFEALQNALPTDAETTSCISKAAGLLHIGFGPMKKENQDDFHLHLGSFGGQRSASLYCVFDGHGVHGKTAAKFSCSHLPGILEEQLKTYFLQVTHPEVGLRGAIEVILCEAFAETEKAMEESGLNISSSGTTATVVYQLDNRLWIASAGDSRAILCSTSPEGGWGSQPLTLDHRPKRASETRRLTSAGGRVEPKRLPSGRVVGEPRLWLQDLPSPGLLLSRSLGDLTATSVGCTCEPEITYVTLRRDVDHCLVLASDGIWDVLDNEEVCSIVSMNDDPRCSCEQILNLALEEWEERLSSDNISVVVVNFVWTSTSLSLPTSADTSFGVDTPELGPQSSEEVLEMTGKLRLDHL